MEPDGITKFCARKVRMNRPTTSTEQMLATASNGVSSTAFSLAAVSASDGVLEGGVFLLIILSLCAQMAGGYATVLRFRISEQHGRCASNVQTLRGVPRVPCRVRVYHPRPVAHRGKKAG